MGYYECGNLTISCHLSYLAITNPKSFIVTYQTKQSLWQTPLDKGYSNQQTHRNSLGEVMLPFI